MESGSAYGIRVKGCMDGELGDQCLSIVTSIPSYATLPEKATSKHI